MYERFTDNARRVMQLANQEAQRFNHEYIGTEHILLGLVKNGRGVGADILKNLDVDLRKIRLEVEKIVQPGPEMVTMGKLPQTPRAKKVIEFAMEEARNLNHNYVGTQHLLLALLRDAEFPAAQVLMNLGLDLVRVREQVQNIDDPDAEFEGKPPTPVSAGKTKTPVIDSFCRDLTAAAASGEQAAVGRDTEVEELVRVLCRHTLHNALLISPRGVEHESVVQGLVQRIVTDDVPRRLLGCRVVRLDIMMLIAGTKYRGQYEERVKAIQNEARRNSQTIVVIDGAEWIRTAGRDWEHKMAMLSFLQASETYSIRLIFLMSADMLDNDDSSAEALASSCETIHIEPPSGETLRQLLFSRRSELEEFHQVSLGDEALDYALTLTCQHVAGPLVARLPIQIIDEASATASASIPRPDLSSIRDERESLEREREEAAANQDFDRAASIRDRIERLRSKEDEEIRKWEAIKASVDTEGVRCAFSRITGISMEELDQDDGPLVTVDEIYKVKSSKWLFHEQAASNNDGRGQNVPRGLSEYERLQTESVLQSEQVEISSGLGFVLLPHTDEFQAIYDQAILPAMTENDLEAIKADDIYSPGAILAQVWSFIRRAEVVVADVSSINPNVIFELGLCFGLHRCPILLVRDPGELPFNLRSLRYIQYENSVAGIPSLKEKLGLAIEEFLAATRSPSILEPNSAV